MKVVLDSDALIALLHGGDALADRAQRTLDKLTDLGAELICPASTFAEVATTMQRKLSNGQLAADIVDILLAGDIDIAPIDAALLQQAAKLYSPTGSKQHTFFDALVLAVAKSVKADAIFSFDKWYVGQGMQLAENLSASQTQAQ